MSNRDLKLFKYLNDWIVYVKHARIMLQTCYFGHGKHGTYFPTYEQVLTITKFVSSKFLAGMKRNRQLSIQRYCL
jgi:hypothetical protein